MPRGLREGNGDETIDRLVRKKSKKEGGAVKPTRAAKNQFLQELNGSGGG